MPLGSEVVLGALLLAGFPRGELVLAATFGNVLGSVVNYGIGMFGSEWLLQHLLKLPEHKITRARERFRAWGAASLLLAWVPVIGDPLTVAAGMLRVHPGLFLLLVTAGKWGRYMVLSWAMAGM